MKNIITALFFILLSLGFVATVRADEVKCYQLTPTTDQCEVDGQVYTYFKEEATREDHVKAYTARRLREAELNFQEIVRWHEFAVEVEKTKQLGLLQLLSAPKVSVSTSTGIRTGDFVNSFENTLTSSIDSTVSPTLSSTGGSVGDVISTATTNK